MFMSAEQTGMWCEFT